MSLNSGTTVPLQLASGPETRRRARGAQSRHRRYEDRLEELENEMETMFRMIIKIRRIQRFSPLAQIVELIDRVVQVFQAGNDTHLLRVSPNEIVAATVLACLSSGILAFLLASGLKMFT